MPLQDHMKIISVDDHVIEHPRVWQDRVGTKHQAMAPSIVEDEKGNHVWRYENRIYPQLGLNAVAGKDPKDYGLDPLRYEDMIPGCYDVSERIKDMDIDGVWGALCFPSFPGFAGGVFQRASDRDLALVCVRAWNDWQLDEWCAFAPGRLVPLGILPTWDPTLAAAEVDRLAQRGTRAVSFPDSPVPLGLPSFHDPHHWEPLWDACEANDMPVCLHFGAGSFTPGFNASSLQGEPDPNVPFLSEIVLFATNLMWSASDIIFSGMLQRHPKLKFMLSEGGIGWIPYMMERFDYSWDRHRWYQKVSKTDRPSDLFKKHFWGCFIDDFHGIENRYAIGVENLLIEVDYPHSDCNWPSSRKRIAENLALVPDHEASAIVEHNARRLLKLHE